MAVTELRTRTEIVAGTTAPVEKIRLREDSTLPYKYQWETKRLKFFCL